VAKILGVRIPNIDMHVLPPIFVTRKRRDMEWPVVANDLNEIGGEIGYASTAKIAPQGQNLVRLCGVFHGSKRLTGMRAYGWVGSRHGENK
jgi:hypothetical protein